MTKSTRPLCYLAGCNKPALGAWHSGSLFHSMHCAAIYGNMMARRDGWVKAVVRRLRLRKGGDA